VLVGAAMTLGVVVLWARLFPEIRTLEKLED
jgi:hypothetical protein